MVAQFSTGILAHFSISIYNWDRIGIKGYDKNANSYLIYPFFAF